MTTGWDAGPKPPPPPKGPGGPQQPPPPKGPPGPPLPAIGPNDPPKDQSGFMIEKLKDSPHKHMKGGFNECIGYIHDIPGYTKIIDTMANGGTLNGGDVPTNSQTPKVGSLIVYKPGSYLSGTEQGGGDTADGSKGHVAYVEKVDKNYDANGKLVSYTITVSEAGNGTGDKRRLRTFTVPAKENGEADLQTDEKGRPVVGFYDPSLAGSTPVVNGGAAPSNPGAPISHGSSYTVQSGDTLWGIAQRAGTTVEQLAKANGIKDPDHFTLQIGTVLKVP